MKKKTTDSNTKNQNNSKQDSISSIKATAISIAVFAVGLWLSLIVYLFTTKKGNIFQEYSISKLGSVGDVFNVVTSFTGVGTVILLAFSVLYQRKELTAVKKQIDKQTESSEEEQRKNRTMKLLEQWSDANNKDEEAILNLYHESDLAILKFEDFRTPLIFDLGRSQRFKFIEFLITICSNKDVKKDYIEIDKILYILKENFISDLESTLKESIEKALKPVHKHKGPKFPKGLESLNKEHQRVHNISHESLIIKEKFKACRVQRVINFINQDDSSLDLDEIKQLLF